MFYEMLSGINIGKKLAPARTTDGCIALKLQFKLPSSLDVVIYEEGSTAGGGTIASPVVGCSVIQ